MEDGNPNVSLSIINGRCISCTCNESIIDSRSQSYASHQQFFLPSLPTTPCPSVPNLWPTIMTNCLNMAELDGMLETSDMSIDWYLFAHVQYMWPLMGYDISDLFCPAFSLLAMCCSRCGCGSLQPRHW